MGLDGLEPSTSRLSGVRSNHLSYRPLDQLKKLIPVCCKDHAVTHFQAHRVPGPLSGRIRPVRRIAANNPARSEEFPHRARPAQHRLYKIDPPEAM